MNVENEQGVIVEFAKQAEQAGYKIISIRTEYPDAIIEKDGVEYRTEFEYIASNFIAHKHDVRECDLIICFRNDLSGENTGLSIIALDDPNWKTKRISPIDKSAKVAYYWKLKANDLQNELNQLRKRLSEGIAGYKVYVPNGIEFTIEQRQEIVSQMIDDGLSVKEMAESLNVSGSTIKNDRAAIANSEGTIKNDRRVVLADNGNGKH